MRAAMVRFGWWAVLAVAAAALGLVSWSLRPPSRAPGTATPIQATARLEGAAPPLLSRDAEAGRLLFERYCGACHGRTGDGFGINAPNLPIEVPSLTTSTRVSVWTDAQLVARIAQGGGTSERPLVCPAWGRRLTGRELDALVAFLRVLLREQP